MGEAEFAIGRRKQSRQNDRLLNVVGVWLLNILVSLIYGVRVSDEACCFKVLTTSNLRAMGLECERFEFCPEVVAKAARMGLRFAEVPVEYFPRSNDQGKKLRLRDGFTAVRTLFRYRHWAPAPISYPPCGRHHLKTSLHEKPR